MNNNDNNNEDSKYIVVVDNIEVGRLYMGSYTVPTPEDAVQKVINGLHQSPAADPAYDIAAEESRSFVVYEVTGNAEDVYREDVQND